MLLCEPGHFRQKFILALKPGIGLVQVNTCVDESLVVSSEIRNTLFG